MNELELAQRRIERERQARKNAEAFLEAKSRELYQANEALHALNDSLELRVVERTLQLSEANRKLQEEIEERKGVEFRLRQARTRLESLINSLQGGVLVEDENRSIVLANQAFCTMFAIPIEPKLLIGHDSVAVFEQSSPLFEDHSQFVRRIGELIQKHELAASEQLRLVDGRILERDYIPIFFDEHYQGHLWHYRDITTAQRTYEILEKTVIETAGKTGSEFFDALTRTLADAVSVHWVDVFETSARGHHLLSAWPPHHSDRLSPDLILRRAAAPQPDECLLAVPLHDAAGKTMGTLAIHDERPIRDRHLAETALLMFAERASAEQMRLRAEEESRSLAMVAARTDNAVVITDVLGRIEYVNEGFERLTGFTRDEVLGRTPGSVLQGPETDPEVVESMRRSLRAGEGFRAEIINYHKSGSKYWVSIEVQPIRDQSGRTIRFMAVESDITHRKRNELRLRLQGEVLEQIATGLPLRAVLNTLCEMVESVLENSCCSVLSLDPTGNLLEISAAPSLDHARLGPRHAIKVELGNGPAASCVLEQQPVVIADCSQDPRCAKVWRVADNLGMCACWAHPIRIENKLCGAVSISRSIKGLATADQSTILEIAASLAGIAFKRHRDASTLEEALRRAEAASSAKSEFLANMSHELRTPLTAITGYADLLSTPENRSAQDAKWARQILRSAQHLGMLLDDLLDLAKVEAGRLTLERQSCDIVALVEEVSGMFRQRAAEKVLGFQVIFAPGLPRRIITDPTRLRQILTNFVSNAIKFTERGEVRVQVDAVKSPHPALAEREIRFMVADSGVGMTPEQISMLFQPFQRLHEATVRAGGTGLGLAISKRLAELMQGRIEITSHTGAGTQFTLVLPLEVAPDDGLDPANSAIIRADVVSALHQHLTARLVGARVLVVDDNADNVSIFTHILEPLGVRVTVATNGQSAVEIVRAQHATGQDFDVILMDMQMPILDGFAATARLRQDGIQTPIVALTAFAMTADQERCFKAGCDLFLAKPARRQALIGTVVQALGLRNPEPSRPPAAAVPPAPSPPAPAPALAPREDPYAPPTTGFARLLEQYKNSLRRYLTNIETAESTRDSEEISRTVHRLKGTGSNYGFPEITRVAGTCETRLRGGATVEQISAELGQLKTLIRQAVAE